MEINYITDPAKELRALAMAYVKGQDLSGCSPEEVLDMYSDALSRIWKHYEENY